MTKSELYNNIQARRLDRIIDYLESLNQNIRRAYNSRVRHYMLKEHTILVVRNFFNYFENCSIPLNRELFIVFLLLHDIGKAKAHDEGFRERQHYYSFEIIKSVWNRMPFIEDDLLVISCLLRQDSVGRYFQNKISLRKCTQEIKRSSKKAKLETSDFFYLTIVFYQCDTAAYTKDDGGIPYLEHVYNYKNGRKSFNKSDCLLEFSPKFSRLYFKLKKSICGN